MFFTLRNSQFAIPSAERRVVALGNFDGVHLGHRVVLRRAVEEARGRGLRSVAATFDPHPRSVLRPDGAPLLLSDIETRGELLLGAGMDEVAVITFDNELSKKSPEEFVREILVERLDAGFVVVGGNFRFGYKAAGDIGELRRLMRSFGGEVFGVPVRGSNGGGGEISSTRIREFLGEGRVEDASRLLGRPYSVRGEVVFGDMRGRTIGFPTANVEPSPDVIIPARGVYACFVEVDGKRFASCANIGVAPTFGERESRVEAHVLDFDGDLYGKVVEVEFLRRIRGEKKFSGVDELVAQIRRDSEEARRITDAAK